MQLGLDFTRELTPETVLVALRARLGAANGITATQLVEAITGTKNTADERRLRDIVTQLRRQGRPVCAHPSHGYFMAANARELDETCEFLYGRALSSLEQISALKNLAMPDLRGQLGLPLPSTSPTETEHDTA